jgi:glycosyltransferase involved in cell wall biosynthesis
MCCGAVPVVSAVGELGDVVRDGESGFLVPSRRPDDYVERVLEVLSDEGRREELSRQARKVAAAHAGLDAVSARWDALLARLTSA